MYPNSQLIDLLTPTTQNHSFSPVAHMLCTESAGDSGRGKMALDIVSFNYANPTQVATSDQNIIGIKNQLKPRAFT